MTLAENVLKIREAHRQQDKLVVELMQSSVVEKAKLDVPEYEWYYYNLARGLEEMTLEKWCAEMTTLTASTGRFGFYCKGTKDQIRVVKAVVDNLRPLFHNV